MGLNGIDISSWQEDLVASKMTTCDFVIVKATDGKGYSNGCFRRHADETLAACKLLGCYHYARDRGYEGTAEQEADWFIAAFRPYVGKAIPFLDWEADALALGPAWAKKWLDCVKSETGVTPGIYTSKACCSPTTGLQLRRPTRCGWRSTRTTRRRASSLSPGRTAGTSGRGTPRFCSSTRAPGASTSTRAT